jgi:hypothetical protein
LVCGACHNQDNVFTHERDAMLSKEHESTDHHFVIVVRLKNKEITEFIPACSETVSIIYVQSKAKK